MRECVAALESEIDIQAVLGRCFRAGHESLRDDYERALYPTSSRASAHRAQLVRQVTRYDDSYLLCCLHGPSGIIPGPPSSRAAKSRRARRRVSDRISGQTSCGVRGTATALQLDLGQDGDALSGSRAR